MAAVDLGEVYLPKSEIAKQCGIYEACTIWRSGAVFSPIAPDASDCVKSHERKHRAGWLHDKREIYRQDCG